MKVEIITSQKEYLGGVGTPCGIPLVGRFPWALGIPWGPLAE